MDEDIQKRANLGRERGGDSAEGVTFVRALERACKMIDVDRSDGSSHWK
jgi:hypothetical protein